MLDTSLVIGSWGPVKTCKTSLGLSFPKPIMHFDFDQGFRRATPRLGDIPYKEILPQEPLNLALFDQGYQVISRAYQMPIAFPGIAQDLTYQLFQSIIIPEIQSAIFDPRIATIIYDTGTLLWNTTHRAELESKKDSQGKPRQSLLPVEYAGPNQSMRFFLAQPKMLGKNVYICHHSKDMYQDFPGSEGRTISKVVGQTWDGWSKMSGLVDMVLATGIKVDMVGNKPTFTPVATFQDCGYTLAVNGLTIENPTYDLIKDTIISHQGE